MNRFQSKINTRTKFHMRFITEFNYIGKMNTYYKSRKYFRKFYKNIWN